MKYLHKHFKYALLGLSLLMIILFFYYKYSSKFTSYGSKPGLITPVINYSVTKYHYHDSTLFTEGFLIHEGKLLESTGSPEDLPDTKSLIGIQDLKSGKFIPKVEIDKTKCFGEGIVVLRNKLYQLTYKNQQGFIYDATSFKLLETFRYKNSEGWGFTTDGQDLIMSDGTDSLSYLDPNNLRPKRVVHVAENEQPVYNLNELEYIDGFLYANIWQQEYIVKIDTQTGKVIGKLDLSSLVYDARTKNPKADVLNGIAV